VWKLSESAFQLLLQRLDPEDRDRAAEQYELLRRKLVKFFEWRGCGGAEELADGTIDRLARRLESGAVAEGGLSSFAYGVARMILLEQRRETSARTLVPLDKAGELAGFDARRDERQRAMEDCFQHCLAALPPDDRALIVAYYQRDKVEKIESRKALAESLGMPINALRIRACRIRAALEGCVQDCTGA
jgi:DNA-directed RNA polymerase specialized sigma24 family protein